MNIQGNKIILETALRVARILGELPTPANQFAVLQIANVLVSNSLATKQPPQDEGDTDAVRQ
jgi:hypothetical protein